MLRQYDGITIGYSHGVEAAQTTIDWNRSSQGNASRVLACSNTAFCYGIYHVVEKSQSFITFIIMIIMNMIYVCANTIEVAYLPRSD